MVKKSIPKGKKNHQNSFLFLILALLKMPSLPEEFNSFCRQAKLEENYKQKIDNKKNNIFSFWN